MDHPGDFRARREATIWQRLNQVLRVLLSIAALLVLLSIFLPQNKKLVQARQEKDEVEARLTAERMLLAAQTRQVNWLKTDPTYLETIVRDKLDMMKEGETIFRLESPQSARNK